MGRFKVSRFCLLLICLAGIFLITAPSFALDADNFKVTPGEEGLVVLPSTKTLPAGTYQVDLYYTYANSPLRGLIGGTWVDLSEYQSLLNAGIALGLTDNFQMGLSIPYLLGQDSDVAGVKGSGFGDLKIEGKWRLFGGKDRMGMALVPYVSFETGENSAYMSANSTVPGILLVIDRNWCNHSALVFNIGYQIQEKEQLPGFSVRGVSVFGIGYAYKLENDKTLVSLEISGKSADGIFGKEEATPVEAFASITQKFSKNTSMTVGVGRGLNSGYGASDWRGFIGFRLAM
jgi:hypothetical protein